MCFSWTNFYSNQTSKPSVKCFHGSLLKPPQLAFWRSLGILRNGFNLFVYDTYINIYIYTYIQTYIYIYICIYTYTCGRTICKFWWWMQTFLHSFARRLLGCQLDFPLPDSPGGHGLNYLSGWFQRFFCFFSLLGEMIQFDGCIFFKMGWNHSLAINCCGISSTVLL